MSETPEPGVIGWREWIALPDLALPAIKAKVDTGALTSALHAFLIEPYTRDGRDMIRFLIHPIQRNQAFEIECHCPVHDYREVADSGGHREMRYVIRSNICLSGNAWPIELTLTNRDTMRFRMLLGRRAMTGRFVVDPSASYLAGKLQPHKLYKIKAES
ncbi:MAG: ATP-dependent zinc protease [Gammaproteobacteria bacterium]|nr:ATP-dependent zinc protease [Gammaproteobacteria bacterium]MDH3537336.1 ATP-dependent zinc protease [Gammaproteobacteria bacterium]